MKRNSTHFLIVTVLVAVTSVIVYLMLAGIYELPVQASAEAEPIDQLFTGHFIMIAFLFSLIMVFMVYSVIAFRRQPGDNTDGIHFHGNTTLEIGWTIVPLITVIGFGIWGAVVLGDITETKDTELVVNVTGVQWSWSFSYPDYEQVGNSPELVLPVNQTIRLRMNSDNVLHSFWVPEFRVKQDLVPGMETTLRVTPTEIGEYKVRCAEICGLNHATMLAPVRVVSQEDFDDWIGGFEGALAEASPVERGSKWAADYGCISCHSVDGSIIAGPSWAGLFGRQETLDDGTTVTVDEDYLRESILNPNAHIVEGFNSGVMPDNFADRFEMEEEAILESEGLEVDIVEDLIAYIISLSTSESE